MALDFESGLGREFQFQVAEQPRQAHGVVLRPAGKAGAPPPAVSMRSGESSQQIAARAKALQDEGNLAAAVDTYLQAIPLGGAYGVLAFVYANLGICHHLQGNFLRAAEFHDNMLQVATTAEDRELQCQAHTNKGITNCALGRFRDAIADHERALGLALAEGLVEDQMRAHANLGNALGSSGAFKRALEHHEQQLRLARKLQDADAEARAHYNLENDAVCLRRYGPARAYRKNKTSGAPAGKLPLNSGFADHAHGHEVRTGWVYKHTGGDADGPRAVGEVLLWAVLRDSLFAYSATVRADERALRYIKVQDIETAETVLLPDDDTTEDMPLSFRILVLHPRRRWFYFSCETFPEARAWTESLHRAQSSAAQFTGQRQVLGGGSSGGTLAGAASDFFRPSAGSVEGNERLKPAAELASFSAPPGFVNASSVRHNPLFAAAEDEDAAPGGGTAGADLLYDEEVDGEEEDGEGRGEEGIDIEAINLAFGHQPDAGSTSAVRQAWMRENSSVARAAERLASGDTNYDAALLGTHLHKDPSGAAPSVAQIGAACEQLKAEPHPTVKEPLQLTVRPEVVTILSSNAADNAMPFLEHPVPRLANVLCFDDVVVIIERDTSGPSDAFTLYAYQCAADRQARTVKSTIAAQMTGPTTASSRNSIASLASSVMVGDIEDSSMLHTPMPGTRQAVGGLTMDVPRSHEADDSLIAPVDTIVVNPPEGYAAFSRPNGTPGAATHAAFQHRYNGQDTGADDRNPGGSGPFDSLRFQPDPEGAEAERQVVALDNGDQYTLSRKASTRFDDDPADEYIGIGGGEGGAGQDEYLRLNGDGDGDGDGDGGNTSRISQAGYDVPVVRAMEGEEAYEEIYMVPVTPTVDLAGRHAGEEFSTSPGRATAASASMLEGPIPGEEISASGERRLDAHRLEGRVAGEDIQVTDFSAQHSFSGHVPGEEMPTDAQLRGAPALQLKRGAEGEGGEGDGLGELREALSYL